jgi:hypothetical protein
LAIRLRVAFFWWRWGSVVSGVVGSVVGEKACYIRLSIYFFFYYKKRDYTVVSHTPYTVRVTTVTTVNNAALKPFSRLAI